MTSCAVVTRNAWKSYICRYSQPEIVVHFTIDASIHAGGERSQQIYSGLEFRHAYDFHWRCQRILQQIAADFNYGDFKGSAFLYALQLYSILSK